MAKAGKRYTELTGNIWSYSRRNDVTGIKAALARGVSVDMQNTAGWTALHAAASNNSIRACKVLLKAGADLGARDRGGGLAIHEAAKNGHLQALLLLKDAGANLAEIRLSQTKGAAVRELVAKATQARDRAGGGGGGGLGAGGGEDGPDSGPAVGYERKQAKSNAFFGPRKTPISGKLKKEILQRKRRAKLDTNVLQLSTGDGGGNGNGNGNGNSSGDDDADVHGDSIGGLPVTDSYPPAAATAKGDDGAGAASLDITGAASKEGGDGDGDGAIPAASAELRPSFSVAVRTAQKTRKQARRAKTRRGHAGEEPNPGGRQLSRKALRALERAAALEGPDHDDDAEAW